MAEAAGLAIAVVQISTQISKLCYQYSKDVKHAADDIALLIRRVEELQGACRSLQSLLDGPNGHALRASQELRGAMGDALALLRKLQQDLTPAKRQSAMKKLGVRALTWPLKKGGVNDTVRELARCRDAMIMSLQTDQTNLLLEVDRRILNLDQQTVFDKLPVAQGASFDSNEESRLRLCHWDTRRGVLSDIQSWSLGRPLDQGRDFRTVFWLNGMAGTGKSTVARTMALSFAHSGLLGASFFFRRGRADRGGLSKFFTTIASQLAVANSAMALRVKEALDADPGIVDKGPQLQYQKLVLEPLSKTPSRSWRGSTVMVILDALDECDDEDDIRLIIGLFSRTKTLQPVRLQVLVTSRPELPIRLGFASNSGLYDDLILHEIPVPVIEHDLRAFLKFEVARIRKNYNITVQPHRQLPVGWPDESDIQTLTEMAVPLFIFASTICGFLEERKIGAPNELLDKVLTYRTRSQASKLDGTYMPVLDSLLLGLSEKEKRATQALFRDLVGSIVLLADPLSTSALSTLLDIPIGSVENMLDLLHSVLGVPESTHSPVQPLHLSFRDFLLDPEKSEKSEFWVDETEAHRRLAKHCLRVMGRGLRTDICELGSLDASVSSLTPERISQKIPPELQYSCLYWAHHLQRAGEVLRDGDEVHDFLKLHFLQWTEASSIMGKRAEALRCLQALSSLVSTQSTTQLSSFVEDSIPFFHFVCFASVFPLQIYASGPTFAPRGSVVRKAFEDMIPDWIAQLPDVESDWDSCLPTWESSNWIESLAFSHDSKLLATGHGNGTIRTWDTNTGTCQKVLVGTTGFDTAPWLMPSSPVIALSFSPDSKLVAFGGYSGARGICRTNTGELIHAFVMPAGSLVVAMSFSSDPRLVAFGSRGEAGSQLTVWQIETDTLLWGSGPHLGRTRSVAFSSCSTLIAAGFDWGIRIWQARSGASKVAIDLPEVEEVVFSPDAALLATAHWKSGRMLGSIDLWDVNTGTWLKQLGGADDFYDSRFLTWTGLFPDMQCIAAAGRDGCVRVWRADSGQEVLRGPPLSSPDIISRSALSVNLKFLATSHSNRGLRIWRRSLEANRPETDAWENDAASSSEFGTSITVSGSGSSVTTTNWEGLTRVWDPATGRCILRGRDVAAAALSPDSKVVALLSRQNDLVLRCALTGNLLSVFSARGGFGDARWTNCRLGYSSDGMLLYAVYGHKMCRPAGGEPGQLHIWNVKASERLQALPCVDAPDHLAISSHLPLIALGSRFLQTIQVWTNTGRRLLEVETQSQAAHAIALARRSPLVAASCNETIYVWDCGNAKEPVTIRGRFLPSGVLAFWGRDAFLAVSVAGGNGFWGGVSLWHLETKSCVLGVGTGFNCHSLGSYDGHLTTNGGILAIDRAWLTTPSLSGSRPPGAATGLRDASGLRRGIWIDGDWLLHGDKRLLLLPPDYRPETTAVAGQNMVLACQSGRVLFVRMDEERVSQL